MSKRRSKPRTLSYYAEPKPRKWDLRRYAKVELNRNLSSRKMRAEHRSKINKKCKPLPIKKTYKKWLQRTEKDS